MKYILFILLFCSMNVSFGQELKLYPPGGHTDKIRSNQVSGNSKYFITSGDDNRVIIWDIKTGKKVMEEVLRESTYFNVGFSRTSRYAYTLTRDTIHFWNLQNKLEHTSLSLDKGSYNEFDFNEIDFNANDSELLVSDGYSITILNLEQNFDTLWHSKAELKNFDVYTGYFSPNSKPWPKTQLIIQKLNGSNSSLYFIGNDNLPRIDGNELTLIDCAKNKVQWKINGAAIYDKSFSENRNYCFASINHKLHRLNFVSQEIAASDLWTVPYIHYPCSASGDGNSLFLKSRENITDFPYNVSWNVENGKIQSFHDSFNVGQGFGIEIVDEADFAFDSRYLYVINQSDSLKTYDFALKKFTHSIEIENGGHYFEDGERAKKIICTPDGSHAILLYESGFSIIDLVLSKENLTPKSIDRNDIVEIKMSPDKEHIALLSPDQLIVLNSKRGEIVYQYHSEERNLITRTGNHWSYSSELIGSEFATDSIIAIQTDYLNEMIWVNFITGEVHRNNSIIQDAFFIDQGKNVLTLSDNNVSIWSSTGQHLSAWRINTEIHRDLVLITEEKLVFADGKTIRIVNRDTGVEIFVERDDIIDQLGWSSDYTTIIASGKNTQKDIIGVDINSGEVKWTINISQYNDLIWCTIGSSNQVIAFVTTSDSTYAVSIDQSDGSLVSYQLFKPFYARAIRTSPDEKNIAIYTGDSLMEFDIINETLRVISSDLYKDESLYWSGNSNAKVDYTMDGKGILAVSDGMMGYDFEVPIVKVNSSNSSEISFIKDVLADDGCRSRGYLKHGNKIAYARFQEDPGMLDFNMKTYYIANEDGSDEKEVPGLILDIYGSNAIIANTGISLVDTSNYEAKMTIISGPLEYYSSYDYENVKWKSSSHRLLTRSVLNGKPYIIQNLNDDLLFWSPYSGVVEKYEEKTIDVIHDLVYSESQKHLMIRNEYGSELFEIETNKKVMSTKMNLYGDIEESSFIGDPMNFDYHDASGLLVQTMWSEPSYLLINNTNTDSIIEFYPHGYYQDNIRISSDGNLIVAFSQNGDIDLLSKEGNSISIIETNLNYISDLIFDANSEKLFITGDGTVLIWDIATNKKVTEFSLMKNGGLAAFDSVGRFDANQIAMDNMNFVYFDSNNNIEIIDLEQLKDRYWIPRLWEKIMDGEDLPNLRGMDKLKLQPQVQLGIIENGKIPITLTRRDGGYGNVSVFINGKEISNDVRGDQLNPSLEKQTIYVDVKDHPYLVSGENEIMVKASSEDGFVQGRGDLLKFIKETQAKQKPVFYGIIIGVDDYVNDNIDLAYPSKDAESISKAVEIGAKNLFGIDKQFVYTITSEGNIRPNKENIKKIFNEIAVNAKAEDVIMVYLSGHGVTWGNEDGGDFYFLTADATSAHKDAYSDPAIRAMNTISTAEFVDWIKEIPALKQVMIIDACGSGKAVDNLLAARDVEASQIKAIDRMKDRTGMYIISGCAADAVSYEASQYGQGLLTYSILQAMKGAALKENQYVDVFTILDHARETVPKLAEGIGGIQTPQLLIPKGGSFDIGILNDEDKSLIPLAEPKTVFIRSTLVDKKKFKDVLGLGIQLDEALSTIASKGSEANIIFFDAAEYGNACQISGGYLQTEDGIEASITITCSENETVHDVSASTPSELVDKIVQLANIAE